MNHHEIRSHGSRDCTVLALARVRRTQRIMLITRLLFAGPEDHRKPLPVLVFVHGESYSFGTGNAFDGSVLALQAKALVVTFNYRLGPLGEEITRSLFSADTAILRLSFLLSLSLPVLQYFLSENIKCIRNLK